MSKTHCWRSLGTATLLAVLVLIPPPIIAGETGEMISNVRPSGLASFMDHLAGRTVRVRNARVVGVFNPRAFLIESATSLPAPLGTRDRILVLVDGEAALRVAPAALVGSTVVVVGVARTLLGMQMTAEVPWPRELTQEAVKRLDVRGAVLARSIQTAEGVELAK